MRPICVQCGREMNCVKNGVIIYHPYERPEPGPTQETVGNIVVVHTDRLITYSPDHPIDFVVQGDKYKCPKCGIEIVTGLGQIMVDYVYPQEMLIDLVSKADEAIEILRK